jgi:hypothetical protein
MLWCSSCAPSLLSLGCFGVQPIVLDGTVGLQYPNTVGSRCRAQYTATSFKGVYAPLPPLARTPVKVRLMAPGAVSLVGSYLLHTNTKPDLNVDVAVEMPKVSAPLLCCSHMVGCLRMHQSGHTKFCHCSFYAKRAPV